MKNMVSESLYPSSVSLLVLGAAPHRRLPSAPDTRAAGDDLDACLLMPPATALH